MHKKTANLMRQIICIAIFIFVYTVKAHSNDNQPYNVLLINLTSARADHLKTYGYKKNTAPNIDELAKEGVIFEQAIAQSYWTLPSFASILTSRYVHSHGVYDRGQKITNKELTLPEILKIYGYKTAAFVGGLDIVGAYGFDYRFDYFFDDTADKPMGSFKDIIPRATKWLTENKDNKFFLLIQGYDAHPPFNKSNPYENIPDEGYDGIIDNLELDYNLLKNIHNDTLFFHGKAIRLDKKDINHIIAHYDSGISYADKFIGELLNRVKELGLFNKTIVIITSEHGEELLDHGSFERFGRKNLYDETILVPLIIRHPSIDSRGKRITTQVQLIDIMPTILDFLGIVVNKEAQGLSLVPLISGGADSSNFNKYVYSEASPYKWAIRTKEWKLIYESGKYELYNIEKDKAEINNVAVQHPDIVYELMQRILEWQRMTMTERSPDDSHIELTGEIKKKLKKAGYW